MIMCWRTPTLTWKSWCNRTRTRLPTWRKEIERKQDAAGMDRVRRNAIADLQDELERKQGWLAQLEAEQKRRAAAV
jgi:hypothetical protein